MIDIDVAARVFLKSAHIVILFIIVFGTLFHKRKDYAMAACFVCFVLIFNPFLKFLFKVPLFPHLGDGYAFPSGHMHAAAIFYGYLFYTINNLKIRLVIIILLCCFGFSLVHCHFHDWIDVFGAVAFAATEITAYHFMKKKFSEKFMAIFGMLLSSSIICIMQFLYKVEPYAWCSLVTLIGIIFFINIFDRVLISTCKEMQKYKRNCTSCLSSQVSNFFSRFSSK